MKKYSLTLVVMLFCLNLIIAQNETPDTLKCFNYSLEYLLTEHQDIEWKDKCFNYGNIMANDGFWLIYFDKGNQIAIKGVIRKGENIGLWTSYFPSGAIASVYIYSSNGRLQNITGFHENGEIRVLIYFRPDTYELLIEKRWTNKGREIKN